MFKNKKRLDEQPEWNEMRSKLSAHFSEAELQRFGEMAGDSLDFVEIVMALEERLKIRLF